MGGSRHLIELPQNKFTSAKTRGSARERSSWLTWKVNVLLAPGALLQNRSPADLWWVETQPGCSDDLSLLRIMYPRRNAHGTSIDRPTAGAPSTCEAISTRSRCAMPSSQDLSITMSTRDGRVPLSSQGNREKTRRAGSAERFDRNRRVSRRPLLADCCAQDRLSELIALSRRPGLESALFPRHAFSQRRY
jgi:hypothetical protein